MTDTAIAYVRDDGVVVIRASAAGKCIRALVAALQGIEEAAPTEHIERVMSEGHLHERGVREKMVDEGLVVTDDQLEVEYWVIPNKLVIVGHIDGRTSENRVLEVKAMSAKAFAEWAKHRFEYRPEYAWQISIYMLAMGFPDHLAGADYRVKRRDDGLIDQAYLDELPIPEKEIKLKAIRVLKAWKTGEWPDCDIPERQRWFCPYFFLHDEAKDDDPDLEIPTEDIPELDMVAAEYVEITEVEREAKTRKKELKKLLETYRQGRDTFATEHFTIKIYPKTRTSTDRTKLIVELGEAKAAEFDKTSEWEEWRIRERKG